VLCHGFAWTHREVAELLGVSPSTVQNHVERGLDKLRACLGGDRYERSG
jgi:DNA-directed RNA polymerase specialized sigma24 family protein